MSHEHHYKVVSPLSDPECEICRQTPVQVKLDEQRQEIASLREQLEAAQQRMSYLEQGNATLLQQAADLMERAGAAEARAEQMWAALDMAGDFIMATPNSHGPVWETNRYAVLKAMDAALASIPKEPWELHKFEDLPCSIYPDTWSKGP